MAVTDTRCVRWCGRQHDRARARVYWDALAGWPYRIRTGESVRELSAWNSATTWPELAARRAAETIRVRRLRRGRTMRPRSVSRGL